MDVPGWRRVDEDARRRDVHGRRRRHPRLEQRHARRAWQQLGARSWRGARAPGVAHARPAELRLVLGTASRQSVGVSRPAVLTGQRPGGRLHRDGPGRGRLRAVGSEIQFPDPGPPLAPSRHGSSTSTDGTTWTLNDPTAPEFAGGSMVGVAAGPVGVVAVGDTGVAATAVVLAATGAPGRACPVRSRRRRRRSAAWRLVRPDSWPSVTRAATGSPGSRPDGRSWRSVRSPHWRTHGCCRVRWLGSEFVATGEDTNGDGAAWHSRRRPDLARLDTGSIFAGASSSAPSRSGRAYVLFGTDATARALRPRAAWRCRQPCPDLALVGRSPASPRS